MPRTIFIKKMDGMHLARMRSDDLIKQGKKGFSEKEIEELAASLQMALDCHALFWLSYENSLAEPLDLTKWKNPDSSSPPESAFKCSFGDVDLFWIYYGGASAEIILAQLNGKTVLRGSFFYIFPYVQAREYGRNSANKELSKAVRKELKRLKSSVPG